MHLVGRKRGKFNESDLRVCNGCDVGRFSADHRGRCMMCINPGKLPDGTRIACRLCWQCVENRINDWVGRCIAESQTAKAWDMVTLTYGRDEHGNEDHPRAKALTFSDVQKYIRLLKRHGFPCRYFAVGEYGSKKGRAHWHLIMFWLKERPPFAGYDSSGRWSDDHKSVGRLCTRFNHQRLDEDGKPVFYENGEPAFYWPHGFSERGDSSAGSVRYACKYVFLDKWEDERQGHLSMSKYPPLGTEFFEREAERYAKAGLAPQDLFYSFPDVTDKEGRKIRFLLKGASAERFLAHYVKAWGELHQGRSLPRSELVENFLDPQSQARFKPNGHEIRPEIEKDWAFQRDWSERIRQAQLADHGRKHGSVGGAHNSAHYYRLSNGEA